MTSTADCRIIAKTRSFAAADASSAASLRNEKTSCLVPFAANSNPPEIENICSSYEGMKDVTNWHVSHKQIKVF